MSVQSACAPLIESRSRLAAARVLTVGGASVEHSYAIPGEFEPDTKYSTPPQPRLAGGSSVNHACRLLAMGIDVHAVVPLAKADPLSAVIVRALEEAEQTGEASFRRGDLFVRGADLTTPYTTIIRQGASRAALNEFAPALMERFGEHLDRRRREAFVDCHPQSPGQRQGEGRLPVTPRSPSPGPAHASPSWARHQPAGPSQPSKRSHASDAARRSTPKPTSRSSTP